MKLLIIYKKIIRRLYKPYIYIIAYIWRRLLFKTTFIGITGSVGKTTAKECLYAILSADYSVIKTLDSRNNEIEVPRTILRVRPRHQFAIVEIGTDRPGVIKKLTRLVHPDIAVVLSVARTHTYNFANLEDTAAEKSQILKKLNNKGVAILNADDDRVNKMDSNLNCKVIKFGYSTKTDIWADEIKSKWPDKLSFRIHSDSETQFIQTNFLGVHWVSSVLAAFAAAQVCKIDLAAAAKQIKKVEPFMARMQPVQIPCGATIIRDEFSASPDTFNAAIQFLKETSATRKVFVTSNISDSPDNSRNRLKKIGELISPIVDMAIFIGRDAHYGVKAAIASGMNNNSVLKFEHIRDAANYLKTELRSQDLVLLKGRTTDHLSRIFFAQIGNIGCWKNNCRRTTICDMCDELNPEFDIQPLLPQDLRK